MQEKRVFLALLLFLAAVTFAGCETSTGAVKGIGTGLGATAEGIGKGAVKDSTDTAGFIMGVDDWIRKNLW